MVIYWMLRVLLNFKSYLEVCSIFYIIIPQLAFFFTRLCQFIACPTIHPEALKWVLRYLHGIVTYGFQLMKSISLVRVHSVYSLVTI